MADQEKSAGQLNYEAYRDRAGDPHLPPWESLAPEIRAAWDGRADEVLRADVTRAEWNQGTEYR